MSMPRSLWGWWWLPSRLALLLGVGALSAVGARAGAAEPQADKALARVPLQSAKSFGELLVWADGGRIYVSEAGKPAQALELRDTAEARHLRDLLERDGASPASPRAVPHRMILAGSGGSGFQRPSGSANPRASGDSGTSGSFKDGSPNQQSGAPADRQPAGRAKQG